MTSSALTSEQLQHLLLMAAAENDAPHTPDVFTVNPLTDQVLASLAREQQFARGEIVFAEGAVGEEMYIVHSGHVLIFKDTLEAPVVLGYRAPGEIFGEMALIEDQPRTATAVAVDDSIVWSIERASFQAWLAQQPATSLSFLRMVSARLRETDRFLTYTKAGQRQLQGEVVELKGEKERLLKLQQMRQELVSFLVHDMRSPLMAIVSTLALLQMVLPREVDDEQSEMLNIAVTSTARLTRLIDTLLEVSRLESGNFPLERSEVRLDALLAEVAQQMEPLARRNRVTIAVEAVGLPPVLADRALLERVLTNLLDNALKYSPSGGTIMLRAVAEVDHVIVAVSDTGLGIPADQRERVFEWFAQIGGEKLKRRGFGLGLTFCRLAIEAHGGRIWVESGADSTGTQFVFSLPLPTAS